jgi:hypothetical protein
VEQFKISDIAELSTLKTTLKATNLVLIFGGKKLITDLKIFKYFRDSYPKAHIISMTTAGEIIGTEVNDHTLSVTAIQFEKTAIKTVSASIKVAEQSHSIGQALTKKLDQKNLCHVMAFCEGININGSELITGIRSSLPSDIKVTGGLAGDQDRFLETYVGVNQVAQKNQIVLIGFYGENLQIGSGSVGGWDPFGPRRLITKSRGNIVYEIDNKPILPLYKTYLGDQAKDLPGSGLLFPLSIEVGDNENHSKIVRTLLGINESDQSITFAGDIPQGCYAQLMKANFDRLIDGAAQAAEYSLEALKNKAQLAILISCVGRKLILKQRVEEEVENVQDILGCQCSLCGFYSYGEIAPTVQANKPCKLHNQTMAITVFHEN